MRRYVQVSSIGVERAPAAGPDDVFGAYLVAKKAAEDDLRARPLDWTILRPGRLTDDPARDACGWPARRAGAVTRDDVAAVLVALLDTPAHRRGGAGTGRRRHPGRRRGRGRGAVAADR